MVQLTNYLLILNLNDIYHFIYLKNLNNNSVNKYIYEIFLNLFLMPLRFIIKIKINYKFFYFIHKI